MPRVTLSPDEKGYTVISGLRRQAVGFGDGVYTKEEALTKVIQLACASSGLDECDHITSAIMQRENTLSTGIGLEVAVPHCRSDHIKSRLLAVLLVRHGIEYNSVDGLPVKLMFLIVSPGHDVQGHISCLSAISHAISDEATRRALIGSSTPDELFTRLQAIGI